MAMRLVAATMILVASTAWGLDGATRCCVDRLRVTGARERQLFSCHAKAAARGVAVDPECVARVQASLASRFAKVESSNGCPSGGDAASVASDLERVIGLVIDVLRPSLDASTCTARKLKATGRFAQSVLRAIAEFPPRPGDRLDEINVLLQPLTSKLTSSFATLEARGGCLTTGDDTLVAQLVTTGSSLGPPLADGALLTALRLCPRCGDNARGGSEQCDGFDAFECDGPCNATCECPRCGDGIKNRTSETCDGDDDAACDGLCQTDCTCPPPVCGNGVQEAGEDCDGGLSAQCGAGCQPDCTCTPPVCGDGIVQAPEQCEGGQNCRAPGPGGCTFCDGGYCPINGCCEAGDVCTSNDGVSGSCFRTYCRPDRACNAGFQCVPTDSSGNGVCASPIGSPCRYLSFIVPCVPPGICSGPNPFGVWYCCAPPDSPCTTNAQCCSGACNAGTCS